MDQRRNRQWTVAVDVPEFDTPIYLKVANNRDVIFELRRWALYHKVGAIHVKGWRVITRAGSLDNIPDHINP